MKAVILAGGFGTRLSEETNLKPKPMIEIGGKPILWHIMNIYSAHGINDFIICCGYKGHLIKEYFQDYFLHHSDVTFTIKDNKMKLHQNTTEPWKVTLVDTGKSTMTGGRLKRVKQYVKKENAFCFTYGDGVGDIDITSLIKFHFYHGKKATITATRPPGRFGVLKLGDQNVVEDFIEKPQGDGNWINGGFFVLNPSVIDFIKDDETSWEKEPLKILAKNKEIHAFKHFGFWQPMDTLWEKNLLNELWHNKNAPWKIWK